MFSYEVRPADPLTARLWEGEQRLSNSEFFGRAVKRQFGVYNTLGLVATENSIVEADLAEGPVEYTEEGVAPAYTNALTQEDWRASEWFDERLEYSPRMTPTRARILKESLDRRDAEDAVLERESQTLGRQALYLGAGFVAALPDPINLLPVGVGAKAATLGGAVLRGAAAGTAGSLAADAVILPWARAYGEQVGAKELMMDAVFGAVLGAGFGAAGHSLARWLERRREGRAATDLHTPEGDAEAPRTPEGDAPDAYGEYLLGMLEATRGEPADGHALGAVRNELLGQDRVRAGQLIDAVLRDIGEERPLDVDGHARRMGMDGPPYIPDGLPVVKTAGLIADGKRPLWPRDMNFEELIPLARDWYVNNLAGRTVPSRLGEVQIIESRWGKLRGSLSPDKLRLVPFIEEILRDAVKIGEEAASREGAARMGVKRHYLRAGVELDGKTLDVTLSVQEAANGRFFYNLSEWGEFGEDGWGRRYPPQHQGPSAGETHDNGGSDIGAGSTDRGLIAADEKAGDFGAVSTQEISPSPDGVNMVVRDVTPDWTPEPSAPEAAAATPESRELADMALDHEADRLTAEGAGTPEERAVLEQTAEEIELVNREEEAALSVLECVMGATQ
jgi:hypothetical protein